MSTVKADLEHSCWTADYLLAHCEGFRVESSEGTLGYVEEIVWARDRSEPLALRVRSGFGEQGLVTLVIEDVLGLHPKGERIVVRAQTGRAAPLEMHRPAAQPKAGRRITKRGSRPSVELSAQ